MNSVLLGAIAMASSVAALFFLRFWRQTRDTLFLLFALAFAVDAITRVTLAVATIPDEHEPFFYMARLVTFALILIAIPAATTGGIRREMCTSPTVESASATSCPRSDRVASSRPRSSVTRNTS